MSKWRKALKNKRRFDARYFLSEKVEGQEVIENSVQQEKLKKDFRDFSFDSWITEEKGKYDDGDGKDEKCDHIDCESVDEGHDGATKGHSEMSPATKGREMRPFDYDKGEIGDEVFEEESPRYDEPMEELVVPGVMPKGGGDADGMSPAQIRMAKAKEKAKKAREDAKKKGLGPVVDEG
tara:strand:- start:383 stop:919 length:537 start_codon:yes stop_codon:yes gene_type:complete